VVIVPQDLTLSILNSAEELYERESGMRRELRSGVSIKDAYAKYGSF
jgi:regulator of RNase E activity RraA